MPNVNTKANESNINHQFFIQGEREGWRNVDFDTFKEKKESKDTLKGERRTIEKKHNKWKTTQREVMFDKT